MGAVANPANAATALHQKEEKAGAFADYRVEAVHSQLPDQSAYTPAAAQARNPAALFDIPADIAAAVADNKVALVDKLTLEGNFAGDKAEAEVPHVAARPAHHPKADEAVQFDWHSPFVVEVLAEQRAELAGRNARLVEQERPQDERPI